MRDDQFIDQHCWERAGQLEIRHAHTQYGRGMEYYKKRVESIGFTDAGTVLDIGCGCGQYTITLNQANEYATGLDLNRGHLEIAQRAAEIFSTKPTTFVRGDFHHLPYKSECADLVMCYSAIQMWANEPILIKELARVIKPGGKLYMVGDGAGWPFYSFWIDGIKGKRIRAILRAFKLWLVHSVWQQGFKQYGRYFSYLSEREVRQFLQQNRMQIEFFGADGEYGNPNGERFLPLFGQRFFGLPSDFEVVAVKI